jgi:hypothetical protein
MKRRLMLNCRRFLLVYGFFTNNLKYISYNWKFVYLCTPFIGAFYQISVQNHKRFEIKGSKIKRLK